MSKRILVVGAGPVGLVATKSLLEEGFVPICYEREEAFGGLWRYHDEDVTGVSSVMKSTVINSSKELGSFSDFPPPDEASNYMHNSELHKYFVSYVKHFRLMNHIYFHREVTKIELADDYDATGRFDVIHRDTFTSEEMSETFDGVFVCIGHHVYPHWPTFPGLEDYEGSTTHTHSLKGCTDFHNKEVAVIGFGNSGIDTAVEGSIVAHQVYLSTRKGAWIIPRVGPNSLPFDLFHITRFKSWLTNMLPFRVANWYHESLLNRWFDHSLYGIKPNHRFFSQHVSVSDDLPSRLLSGMIKMKKGVKKFTRDGILFEGDEKVTELGQVVFATGYDIKFPFLRDDITMVRQNRVNLYKFMYPPGLRHQTLAILGLIQPIGAIFPLAESQARLASLVLSGKVELPSRVRMQEDVRRRDAITRYRYVESQRHTIQVDYIQFQDEINSMIGTKPNMWSLFFKDFTLWYALLFGPSLPYQYRLEGPHRWPGARNAILTYMDRTIMPLQENYRPAIPKRRFRKLFIMSVLLAGAFGACVAFVRK